MANEKKKSKNTQKEVEAALDRALGRRPADMPPPVAPPACQHPCIQDLDQSKIDEVLMEAEEACERDESEPLPPPTDAPDPVPVEGDPVEDAAPGQTKEEFAKDCMTLKIDAKSCRCQSTKHSDRTIEEHLRNINKRIFAETQNGGFSTNITFRVSQQDWVNVPHIIDWYRNRGFQILNYDTPVAPYGNQAGLLTYTFTISWANA